MILIRILEKSLSTNIRRSFTRITFSRNHSHSGAEGTSIQNMFSHVITRSFVNYHHLWLDHNLSKRKSTSCNQTWKQISRQQDYSSDNLDGLIHITRQLKVKFLTCFLTKKKRENKVWRWRCVVCLWRELGVCRFLAKHQVSDVVVVLLLVPLLLLLRLLFRAFLGVGRGVCRFLAKHQVSDGEEGIYCQT